MTSNAELLERLLARGTIDLRRGESLDRCRALSTSSLVIAGDPEEALVRAVKDTKDNDTIAAIVGAAVGALHGAAALPERWVSGLPGKTRADDEGEVQRILAAARERWGP